MFIRLKEALENWQNKMYEVSTRRCARLTREVRWIGTTVSNLPTFDGLNPLETFLLDFEESVPMQQILLAMDEALKATPTRWWGTHKNNITEWVQCRTLMTSAVLGTSRRLRSSVHRSKIPKGPCAKL
jgi:hypothetical protein